VFVRLARLLCGWGMSTQANLLGALKEAYLTKCGGGHKTWKVRWFVLTKDVLYYFDRENSTEPKGVIPLKDYLKCKGMDGDAYSVTRKENSLYLQTPYRTFKMFAKDWRTSEYWAEAIANIGDFLHKKEDLRSPSSYQAAILTNTGDIINHGSSLNHWFKLIVDSTPSYRTGIPSIYFAGIYDIPRELGLVIIHLTRYSLNAVGQPNNSRYCNDMKDEVVKVIAQIDKAVEFITCCAETHKGNFNADLEVLRRATQALQALNVEEAPAPE